VTDSSRPGDHHDGPYPGGLGSRREARERAFQLLYEAEVKHEPATDVLAQQPLAPDEFAVDLVEGVEAHRAEIDALIVEHARNWELDRMPALDRAILRMATFELAHRPDVPTGATISEAVELAKQYSTDDSSRFVNGVLSAIADQVRE
jgi:transcription antitermination protein NusB